MAPSSNPRFEKLAQLFNRGLDVSEGPERESFIRGACAGDTSLEAELRRLLHSDADVQRRTTASRLPVFGVYHARDLIATGGMGAVYLASREDGEVRQQVAVKVMGGVLWSAAMEDYFRRERQILAGLQHPNIARFLDCGATPDGVPYLVMEFVEGVRVDEWCERARLGIRERLALFLRICAVVSFAHQKLVVHRDLKPGNILVSADGEPKLLDFGVARTLDPDGAPAQTINVFTPLYASPELLRGEGAGVSADVYSLGVLLFELLSGVRPFGASTSSPAEVIEQVLTADPPLPSAVATDPRVRRDLRGELDAIAAKAIDRRLTERYPSVEQLAADVKRYLDGFPVHAAPTGALYRARKFVHRHRTGMTAAVAITATIVAGLVLTLRQRAAAERRFQVARELADYLVFDVQSALEKLPSSTPVRAEIIDRTLTYLDRLAAEKTNDPALQTEVGRGYYVLADVLGAPWRPNIGQAAKARDVYRKAIAVLDPLQSRDARVYAARSRAMLGRSMEFAGASAEGHKLLERGANESRELSRRWPGDFSVRMNAELIWYQWARSLGTGSGFFVTSQNADVASEAARFAAAEGDAALRIRSGDVEVIRALSNIYALLGYMANTKDVVQATPKFRKALTVLDQLSSADRESTVGRQTRGNALLALGSNLGRVGQYSEAIAMTEEACRIRRRLSEEDPRDNGALLNVPAAYNNLAEIQDQAGQLAAALENYAVSEQFWKQVLERNPKNRNARTALADVQAKASRISLKLGHTAEADRLAADALSFYKDAAARPEASHIELTLAAQTLMESPPRLREPKLALDYMKRAAAKVGNDSFVQEMLAQAYDINGDRARAVEALRQALALLGPGDTPERQQILRKLAKTEPRP